MKKRRYDVSLLEKVVFQLAMDEELSQAYRDHPLRGDWEGYRECHIRPDWLLIYKKEDNDLVLLLFRTGTHGDLF